MDCCTIGLLCVTKSWIMWVGLDRSISRGDEKICRSLGKMSLEQAYSARAWLATRVCVSEDGVLVWWSS